jgi:hypothetical protein
MATEEEVVFDTLYDEEDDLRSESGSMVQRNEPSGSRDDPGKERGEDGEQKDHHMHEDNQSDAGDEDDK